MKAAILKQYKKIELGETEEPTAGPAQIKLKVMACGLCPTDYRLYTGTATFKKPPTVLGHEPAGLVEAIGDGVKGFSKGDQVAGDTGWRCGRCPACMAGRENLCDNRRQVGDGCLAEYTLVDERYITKFSRAKFTEASFTEPLACVLHSVANSEIMNEDVLAIIGSGQIGLMHMQVAKLVGARTIVIDVKQDRLDMAERLGSDYVVNSSKEDVAAKVKDITRGAKANKVIVATGSPAAVETGLKVVGKLGSVNLFGSTPIGTTSDFEPGMVHHNEISIIGSFDKTRKDLRLATELIDQGKVDVRSLVSNEFNLAETQKAFDLLEAGTGTKMMVRPNTE